MTTYHHEPRSNRFWRAACGAALLLLSLIATPVQASFPATQTNTGSCTVAPCYAYYIQAYQAYAKSTPLAACQDGLARLTAESESLNYVYVSSNQTQCVHDRYFKSGGVFGTGSVAVIEPLSVSPSTPVYSCPANSTLSGSSCTCTAPKEQNAAGTGCQDPACTAGSAGFHRGVVAGEKVNPFNTCLDGCITTAAPRLDLGVAVTSGTPVQTYATFELFRKAESCTGNEGFPSLPATSPSTTPPTPEPECPAGQMRVYLSSGAPSCTPITADRFCPTGYTYGTVNGKDTCIHSGPTPPTASSPATTDKTPTTESKESSTTTTNPDGSTTKVTTKSDGKGGGSTTTTTTSADGKTVESVTQKMGDEDSKCEPGTVGCSKFGTPDAQQPTKSNNTVSLGTGSGITGFLDGCPADRTRQTAAGEVRLSFASACEVAPMVKPLVLLAAAIIAGLIVIQSLRS